METIKSILQELWANRRSRRLVYLFILLGMVIWFIPPVWRLKGDSIEVTRWINKTKGKVVAKVGPSEKGWTKYHRISRHTINAVIAAEDNKFYQHGGLDYEAIRDSFEANLKKGRYARGGSTITQQLIKMAFLSRDKTMLRKACEAVGAILAEHLLEKREILEWYLNMVEFGDGVYGLDHAARHYFGSKPEMLTTAQSIHLALVLPNPTRWSAGLRQRSLTPFGHRRFAAIVSNMYRSGTITKEQWISSLAAGNFGAPIAGYQAVVAQFESDSQSLNDPRFMAPGTGEIEDEAKVDETLSPEESTEQSATTGGAPTETGSGNPAPSPSTSPSTDASLTEEVPTDPELNPSAIQTTPSPDESSEVQEDLGGGE